jgi:uncharacterized cupredoxin-like copper-binding protein
MKSIRIVSIMLACALMLASSAAAQASQKTASKPAQAVKADDAAAKLPAAVLAAFRQSYPKAVIKNASKEVENGKTTWEVESVDGSLARDLVYNPDGTVVDIEEAVAIETLPAAVTAAVKAQYPKASITKAEKLFRADKWTYELTLKGAAKPSIELTPEGKVVPAAKTPEAKEANETKKK